MWFQQTHGRAFVWKANLGRPFLGAVPGSGRRPTATGAADLKEQCLLLERRACAGNEGISNSLFGGEKTVFMSSFRHHGGNKRGGFLSVGEKLLFKRLQCLENF